MKKVGLTNLNSKNKEIPTNMAQNERSGINIPLPVVIGAAIIGISAAMHYGPIIMEKLKDLQGHESMRIGNSISYDSDLYTSRDE